MSDKIKSTTDALKAIAKLQDEAQRDGKWQKADAYSIAITTFVKGVKATQRKITKRQCEADEYWDAQNLLVTDEELAAALKKARE